MLPPPLFLSCGSTTTAPGFYICLLLVVLPAVIPPTRLDGLFIHQQLFGVAVVVVVAAFIGWPP